MKNLMADIKRTICFGEWTCHLPSPVHRGAAYAFAKAVSLLVVVLASSMGESGRSRMSLLNNGESSPPESNSTSDIVTELSSEGKV